MAMQTWKGPWGGMDMREGKNAPNSYFLGLNIDTSNGQLAARASFSLVKYNMPRFGRMHKTTTPDGTEKLLVVGSTTASDAPSNVLFAAVDLNPFAVVESSAVTKQDMTVAFGEPPRNAVKCSFVDTVLADANDNPVFVTLITTEYGSYVYDPKTDATNLRRVVVSTDARRVNNLNVYYGSAPMQAPIACDYNLQTYYAGFRPGQYFGLDGNIPAAVNGKWKMPPEAYIGGDRSWIGLYPHVFMWSDEADPCGIAATNFNIVDPNERITGLHATSQALLVFTDKGIWVQQDPSSGIQKVVNGVGCVSNESIVTVGGVTYFAGVDGIYAFGGLGSPEATKISPQLDPLWAEPDAVASQLPEAMRTYMAALGFPWTIDARWMQTCVGRHIPGPNQIWWSVPVVSAWNAHANGFVLVYDVKGNHWNIYFVYPFFDLAYQSFTNAMSDAVVVDDRVITCTADGYLRELGRGRLDSGPQAPNPPVCAMWCSHRWPLEDTDELELTGVWFRMKATSVSPPVPASGSAVGSGAVPSDTPMWFVEGAESAFDFENDSGVAVTSYDQRQTRTGAMPRHPYTTSSSALGSSFILGTSKLAPTDWFSARAPVSMASKSFRIGFVDMGPTRPAIMQVSSVSLELASRGTPRR